MKTNDLCVICKSCVSTDSMGGDLPTTYSYLADLEGRVFTSKLTDATIVDVRDSTYYLRKVTARQGGYRIVTLTDAIAQEQSAAVEMATLPVVVGLQGEIRGIREDDYSNPIRPLYLAVKAAIDDLEGGGDFGHNLEFE